MANFSIAATALLVASANAFAPNPNPSSIIHKININNNNNINNRSSPASSLHAVSTPLSPLTQWGPAITDIKSTQQQYKSQTKPDFAPTISAKTLNIAGDKDAQLKYIQDNAFELKAKMVENGAVVFRDFELMKEQDGFVKFYETLGMKTCLDPLHSVSARPTVDGKKDSPVYEAVNKESRKNFFIGEFVYFLVVYYYNTFVCLFVHVCVHVCWFVYCLYIHLKLQYNYEYILTHHQYHHQYHHHHLQQECTTNS